MNFYLLNSKVERTSYHPESTFSLHFLSQADKESSSLGRGEECLKKNQVLNMNKQTQGVQEKPELPCK